MFLPSVYPRSRSPCLNASRCGWSREPIKRIPTRGIFPVCCASALTARASSIIATKIDDQPTLLIPHLVADAITHTVIAETIIYGRRETGFVEELEAKFSPGLNRRYSQISQD